MKAEITGKAFNGRQILGSVSLSLKAGDVLALTGPSGIGKTTLMRIIAGLDRQFRGEITGVGTVGMVFQEPTLLPWRNVLDNLTIATGCDRKMAQETLRQVELGDRLAAFPRQLSLGQQRRVSLARALASRPDTLILDEAFSSLDEATAARMRNLVKRILTGSVFQTLLITHNLEDAVDLADDILLLDGHPATIQFTHSVITPRKKRDLQTELEIIRAKIRHDGQIPAP